MTQPKTQNGWTTKSVIVLGLIISALLAGGISLFASSQPDGLERVAIDAGFADTAKESATADSLFADYSVSIFGDSAGGGALAGLIGVAITALVAWGLFAWLRPKDKSDDRS
jgi:hypothetical protein